MKLTTKRRLGLTAIAAIASLGLAACGGESTSTDNGTDASTDSAAVKEIVDMDGNTVEIPADPQRIVATDNRIFGTLAEWDIDLVAAPVDLMPDIDRLDRYTDGETMNMGNHREPDLEVVTAADPDLILNGNRFRDLAEDVQDFSDDAPLVSVEFTNEDGKTIDENLIDQVNVLAEVFDKQDEADEMIAAFEDSIDAARDAYDPEETVAGLITSGGNINYSAPTYGRTVGPIFDVLGLTPALEDDGSGNHQGDDVSVEAIAKANPDWIIVMDRDAAVEDDPATAKELLTKSEALKNVTAIKENQIVYLAPEFYITEDMFYYTDLFNELADVWS